MDLRLSQWVRYALVLTDRHTPHHPLVRVPGRLIQRVAPNPGTERCPDDPLRVETVEDDPQPVALGADQPVRLDLDIVEEQRPLLLRSLDRGRDPLLLQALGVRINGEDR